MRTAWLASFALYRPRLKLFAVAFQLSGFKTIAWASPHFDCEQLFDDRCSSVRRSVDRAANSEGARL